ncbi:MAG: ROK family protein [Dehalococcoidia bacterium]|nr:ROK family protein [Dehalococcoidia bacterium]
MSEPEPALVGVDFTGDTLRLMLGNLSGEIFYRQEFPLPDVDDEEAWAWEVGGRISSAFAAEGERRWALGIGVACPGAVDTATGILMESTANPAWDGLHIVDALRRHIDAPVVALSRTLAALRGEAASGAAAHTFDAIYVSLQDGPSAAIMSNARVIGGANARAGALPAFPEVTAGAPLAGDDLEHAAALLADVVALLDPQVVILHGLPEHTEPLAPVLQRVLDEISPGATVTPPALGDYAALLGAFQAASTVSYEGERDDQP